MTLIELLVILGILAGAGVGAALGWSLHPLLSLVGLALGGWLGTFLMPVLGFVLVTVFTFLEEAPRWLFTRIRAVLSPRTARPPRDLAPDSTSSQHDRD
ncbi:hypothetical protein SAMN05443572_102378 [Myxococcus fulvus]|uniref:Major facilitator superfamily (MFS) profile domain-containing protein n=1 Tax=Myxococcus fulvus TaxID=33 RepID=A0A511SX69_MYXFU|nr:hypothetical protein [Myxococcus fulvus]GEN06510.1 hypothetical protein MFU01_15470 [Myxococcus fulvus]SET46557.1 hypothetical protein SAMN05443572_102378 [Myxococcus fulvus]